MGGVGGVGCFCVKNVMGGHVWQFSDFFIEFSWIPVLFLFVLCTLKTLKWKT
jgi:hypothetical protein